MKEPVVLAKCGHTFEKSAIEQWAKKCKICPVCKKPFDPQVDLKINYTVKSMIDSITNGEIVMKTKNEIEMIKAKKKAKKKKVVKKKSDGENKTEAIDESSKKDEKDIVIEEHTKTVMTKDKNDDKTKEIETKYARPKKENAIWFWLQHECSRWVPYEKSTCERIESAFQAKQPTRISVNIPYLVYYDINFDDMVQINTKTKYIRPIKRCVVQKASKWQWNEFNIWIDYQKDECVILEAAYILNFRMIRMFLNNKWYTINLQYMKQTAEDTGFTRSIRRQ